jgi:prepilin-type N-terminal cleavage/methylation domain-containing protein
MQHTLHHWKQRLNIYTSLPTSMLRFSGFTLSELLVSLSVIGLIAAIGMPNVFNSVEESKRKSLFKDTIRTVQVAYLACVQDGTCTENSFDGLYSRVNALEICTETKPCRTNSDYEAATYDSPGFILPSGVHVWGLKVAMYDPDDAFLIDYNGSDGPNIIGQDILYMMRCFDEVTNGQACVPSGARQHLHGEVDVLSNHTQSVDLYNKVYK